MKATVILVLSLAAGSSFAKETEPQGGFCSLDKSAANARLLMLKGLLEQALLSAVAMGPGRIGLRLKTDHAAAFAEIVELENQCCGGIETHTEADVVAGVTSLTLTAPPHIIKLLTGLLPPARLKPASSPIHGGGSRPPTGRSEGALR